MTKHKKNAKKDNVEIDEDDVPEVNGAAGGDVNAQDPLDKRILAAIAKAVRDEIRKEISPCLKKIEDSLEDLVALQTRVTDVEEAVQFNSRRLDDVVNNMLPAIAQHIAVLTEGLAKQTLNIDVHRRKNNLILHGIEGPADEEEADTRATCVDFARTVLRVADADNTRFAACHRLGRGENAGIIVRFGDISQRDRWLANAKYLKDQEKRITLTPDLPPVLRPLKDDLMRQRSQLAPAVKAKSRIRYLPQWPYVELRVENKQPIRSETSFAAIVHKIVDVHPLLTVAESTS